MATSPEFLAIGHVTKDLLPGGGHALGGTVTYASLAAHRLGLSAAVLTSAPTDLDLPRYLQGIELHVITSPVATTFENAYDGERRHQYVRSTALPLPAAQLPTAWRGAAIVLLGPLVGELGVDWLNACPAALAGVTPQGWMRQWDDTGRVSVKAWSNAQSILSQVDVLVFSEEDVANDEAAVQRYARMARIAAVTRGHRGATVFLDETARDIPAFRAREVDFTGAGDVFAAAFLVRLKETDDPCEAAAFANGAASLCIEGQGIDGIPSRRQVNERVRKGKLR